MLLLAAACTGERPPPLDGTSRATRNDVSIELQVRGHEPGALFPEIVLVNTGTRAVSHASAWKFARWDGEGWVPVKALFDLDRRTLRPGKEFRLPAPGFTHEPQPGYYHPGLAAPGWYRAEVEADPGDLTVAISFRLD